ncbi:MAG: MoaD/ThiS family protein [Betaproteobacteria bacterium]
MRITFKLFAMLADHLPAQVDGNAREANAVSFDVPEGTTVQQLIDRFSLPARLVHLVLIDGRSVETAQRATRVLKDGEALAIWPPIAGG